MACVKYYHKYRRPAICRSAILMSEDFLLYVFNLLNFFNKCIYVGFCCHHNSCKLSIWLKNNVCRVHLYTIFLDYLWPITVFVVDTYAYKLIVEVFCAFLVCKDFILHHFAGYTTIGVTFNEDVFVLLAGLLYGFV